MKGDNGIEQIIANIPFYNKEQLERLQVAVDAEIQNKPNTPRK